MALASKSPRFVSITNAILSTVANFFDPARNLTTREMVTMAQAGNINNQLAFKIGYGV